MDTASFSKGSKGPVEMWRHGATGGVRGRRKVASSGFGGVQAVQPKGADEVNMEAELDRKSVV